MRVFTVLVTCTAAVTEEWVIGLTDEEAARVDGDANEVLELLSERYITVRNTDVREEEDREVASIEEHRLGDGEA